MIQYNRRFALKLGNHGYIKYKRRTYGINLVWSDAPSFEWQFRREGSSGPINTNLPVALFNRVEKDYIVYKKRRYGINLKWLGDTDLTNPHDWKIGGQFPNICLKNITAAKKHKAYVIYGKRSYGINLVWGKKPTPCNFNIEPLADFSLPPRGDYIPGETTIMNNPRPHIWSIEWKGKKGLDFDAYNTTIRSPYIQNVTQDSATVLWRVGIPKKRDSKEWARRLNAKAWIAPKGTKTTAWVLHKTGDSNHPIKTEDITHTYKYENGVKYNNPVPDGQGKSDYWLNYMSDRPVIQFKVTFKALQPGTVYHYRIESDGILDEEDKKLTNIVMANDVYFKTAPSPSQNQKISFVAMGDFGPGDRQPSYFYDVFDLFHRIARKHGPNLWLALGDIDNDTDGHPNAMDPFFFNVYNAFHDKNDPRLTSNTSKAKSTDVKAFRNPPYFGLLGGLPVYPTFGNHDICTGSDSSLNYWVMAYKGSFDLPSEANGWCPSAEEFYDNDNDKGFFYTFRYGDVIFISLGIPRKKCELGNGQNWEEKWGKKQREKLEDYLQSIEKEIEKNNVWVVVYFHDNHYGLSKKGKYPKYGEYAKMFLKEGVDIVLMGHQHFFKQGTVKDQNTGRDYHGVIVGTGGFGDRGNCYDDACDRPGFILVEIQGNVLRYWKYDTHKCNGYRPWYCRRSPEGLPKGRDALKPRIKEYLRITKIARGKHIVEGHVGSWVFG